MNYTAILRNHARNRPTHTAVADVTSGISYAAFDRLVDAAAARLAGEGVRKGDFVAVSMGDRSEYLIVFYGLVRLGAVFFGLAPKLSPEELRRDLAQFEVRWLVSDAEEEAPPGVRVLRVDATWRDATAFAGLPFDMPQGGNMPAYLVPTSGTTNGRSRAVVLTHDNLAQRLRYSQMSVGYGPWDRFASLVPLAFNVGRIHMIQTLQTAGTAMILPPAAAAAMPALLANNAITWMFLTPFHMRQLLKLPPQPQGPLLSGLRQLVVASSALTAAERAAARRLLSANLVEQYGTAQCGMHSMSTAADQAAAPDSVGRIVVGTDAEIVDGDDRPQPAGTVGEIRLRGPGFVSSYWNDAEASARTFRNGWFYPGDLALIDARGYLHLKGRVDDMFIFDGYNIYPDEIEEVLLQHPQVEEAAVVSQHTDQNQEVPVAFLVARDGARPAIEELHAYCAARLSAFKRPRMFYFVASLPKSEVGKTLRRKLRADLPILHVTIPRSPSRG